jgi:flagellin-specific chaperone FliS
MTSDMLNEYRAAMFDGEASVDWLRQGWRALRLYGRKAKAAVAAGDTAGKAEMLLRADRLLTLMTGILDTGAGTTLGPALTNIYSAMQLALLRANAGNDTAALDEFDQAIDALTRDMLPNSTIATAA